MTLNTREITPTEFVVIVCQVHIDRPIDVTWSQIGGFSDAGRFLNIPCKLISGDGGLGSVRQVGDAILEVMAGKSDQSYTYAQIAGPMASFAYHGCVALRVSNLGSCTLTYTIIYDEKQLDETQRGSQVVRITKRFQGAVEAMKRDAEGKI